MANYDVTYTDIDLNATGTTTVYDPSSDATVQGVYLPNGGSTAVVQLEVTDGANTVVVTPGQTAGDAVTVGDDVPVDGDQTVQVNVTAAEGAAQTNTAGVFISG